MIELSAGPAKAVVDPAAGGRLASLSVAGLEILVTEGRDALHRGCYPMAPWVGRLRHGRFVFGGRTHRVPLNWPPHAIHGTTIGQAWSDDGDGWLSTPLGSDWPFAGRAVQHLVLTAEALRLRLEVHASERAFPAALGWHPWFRRSLARGGEAKLHFEAEKMFEVDGDGISTGALVDVPPGPWDACFFGLRSAPRIEWPGALVLELRSALEHWIVFDQPAHALCVEALSGPPNALNLEPRIVEPGHPLVADFEFVWRVED